MCVCACWCVSTDRIPLTQSPLQLLFNFTSAPSVGLVMFHQHATLSQHVTAEYSLYLCVCIYIYVCVCVCVCVCEIMLPSEGMETAGRRQLEGSTVYCCDCCETRHGVVF